MGFIFDLDGTLLDSIMDLGTAMNRVLEGHGLPLHTMETYKTFVGNGIAKLVERSLPEGIDNFDLYYQEYLEEYGAISGQHSQVYDHVIDVLKTLNQRNIPISIHTNKMQVYTDKIVSHYFKGIDFVSVIGDQGDGMIKPNPHHTKIMAKELNADKVFFVGDSDVDMETAVNANLIPVGVTWGFRSVERLKETGAQHLIESFDQLLNLLD